MLSIKACSLTSVVNGWLASTRYPRVLNVFDRSCNLINERREILSIVTSGIGNGPFNLPVEEDVLFARYIDAASQISISFNQITLGCLIFDTKDAKLWNPRPNWERLHNKSDHILTQLKELRIKNYEKCRPDSFLANARIFSPTGSGRGSTTGGVQSLISILPSALVGGDIPIAKEITSRLAGLGVGLTPASDDFFMGALYAVWIIHPPEIAKALGGEIANTAAPLTTALSAAWLGAAGRGDAGIRWHEFFSELVSTNLGQMQYKMYKILDMGATSGSDALAGFFSTFLSYAEIREKLCPS